MRTTVNINDDLLDRAKALALARHESLGEIISEALRVMLFQNTKCESKESFRLLTFKGNGTCPGVDLDSNSSLLDLMEGR